MSHAAVDCDMFFDEQHSTSVYEIGPAQAEVLDLLSWPHRAGRARLTRDQWRTVQRLCIWHDLALTS